MPVAVDALEQARSLAPPPARSRSRRSRRFPRHALILTDAAVVAACALAGGVAVPLAVAGWTAALSRYGLHRSRMVASPRAELVRLVHAVGAGTAVVVAGAAVLGIVLPRPAPARTAALVLAALLVERAVVRIAFRALRRRGRLLRPVAIVGTGPEAVGLATACHDEPGLGYRVVAFVGPSLVADARFDGTPVVPWHGKVVEELRLVGAEGVVVATTDVDPETSNRLVRRLTDAGVHVELSSSLVDVDAHRVSVRPLGRFAVLSVS